MDPLNTVFVDGNTEDQAIEYASLIDQLLEIPADSTDNSLVHETKKLIEEGNWSQIYTKFSSQAHELLKVEGHNLVAAFNLLMSQFKLADNDVLPTLIQNLTESLTQAEHPTGYPKLAMFEILYNSLLPNTPLRLSVFEAIIKVSSKHGIVKTVVTSLPNISSWVTQWGIDQTQARSLYLLLANSLKESEYKKEGYEFLLHYLYTFENKEDITNDVSALAERAIVEAIQIPQVLNFESLILATPVQSLKGQPLYELAEVFLSKDVTSYLDFVGTHKDLISTHSFDEATTMGKIRTLTVAGLGTQHLGTPISYSKLASAMHLDQDSAFETQVEMCIIDVIRAGLIEAKLNQLSGSVTITRTTYRQFSQDHWAKLAEDLDQWKRALDKVVITVQSATIPSPAPRAVEPIAEQ